jgi:hypothetical protein
MEVLQKVYHHLAHREWPGVQTKMLLRTVCARRTSGLRIMTSPLPLSLNRVSTKRIAASGFCSSWVVRETRHGTLNNNDVRLPLLGFATLWA